MIRSQSQTEKQTISETDGNSENQSVRNRGGERQKEREMQRVADLESYDQRATRILNREEEFQREQKRGRGGGKAYAGKGVGSERGSMERLRETVREQKGLGREVEREGWGSQAVEALGEGAEFGCGRERWGGLQLVGEAFWVQWGGPPVSLSPAAPHPWPTNCSFCTLTSLALSQDLIQTPH